MNLKQVFRVHTDITLPGDIVIVEKQGSKLAITVRTRRFGIRRFKSYREYPFNRETIRELYLKALKYRSGASVSLEIFELPASQQI